MTKKKNINSVGTPKRDMHFLKLAMTCSLTHLECQTTLNNRDYTLIHCVKGGAAENNSGM